MVVKVIVFVKCKDKVQESEIWLCSVEPVTHHSSLISTSSTSRFRQHKLHINYCQRLVTVQTTPSFMLFLLRSVVYYGLLKVPRMATMHSIWPHNVTQFDIGAFCNLSSGTGTSWLLFHQLLTVAMKLKAVQCDQGILHIMCTIEEPPHTLMIPGTNLVR